MARSTAWKDLERNAAKRAGTHRTPLSGMNSRHETHSDSLSDTYYIEAKHSGNPNSKYFRIMDRVRNLTTYFKDAQKKHNAVRFIYNDWVLLVFPTNKKNLEFVEINGDAVLNWKRLAIWQWFIDDPYTKSLAENKIPYAILKMKGKKGEFVICREADFERVKEVTLWQHTSV